MLNIANDLNKTALKFLKQIIKNKTKTAEWQVYTIDNIEPNGSFETDEQLNLQSIIEFNKNEHLFFIALNRMRMQKIEIFIC